MLPQFGIKLAVQIIKTDFGNLVAQVCECLLKRGTLTRVAIAKHTELSMDKVTKCLWVLIQHNCVQAFALAEEGGYGQSEKISTQYIALFNNMICRLRFPKLLTLVSKELDKECASVLEGLLQHGRLTLSQILDRATNLSNEGGIVRESFMKLVKARFVERCPAPEPLVSLILESAGSKRGSNANKDQIIEKEVTLEDRVVAAATLMEAERFSVQTASGMDIAEENKTNDLNNKKVGKKRKLKLLEVDGDLDMSGCSEDPTWRVNFDEFKSLFRKKALVESAKSRLDHEAGIVLSAFLDATKGMGKEASLEHVFEEVIRREEGRAMTLEHVRAFLVQLGCSFDTEGSYTLDLGHIIKHSQRQEIESIVLKRYGKEAYRLFRLLSEYRNPVETSGISGKTLVDQKDTKKLLYKMWTDNYLHMEFVRRPQQGDLFHWSVNRNLNELVLEELLHAALNLRIRVAYEMQQGHEVFMLQDKQKGEAKKRFDKLKAVKMLLDSSLAKLDDAIMLFNDF